jgi:hypothetical protein
MALTPVSPNLFDTNFISLRARMLNPYGARGNQVGIVFNYQRVGPFNPGGYTELVFAPTGVARINQVGGGTCGTSRRLHGPPGAMHGSTSPL